MIQPGSTIGIVGGGQLGRMLAIASAQLGYKCHIFDPHEHPCAADVAAAFTRAAYDDRAALEAFGDKVGPGLKSLAVAQDRADEKSFIESTGARVAQWRACASLDDVTHAISE